MKPMLCYREKSPFIYKGYWLSAGKGSGNQATDSWCVYRYDKTATENPTTRYHNLNTADLEQAKQMMRAWVDAREQELIGKADAVKHTTTTIAAVQIEPTYSEGQKIEEAIMQWWDSVASRWKIGSEQEVADKLGIARAKVAYVRQREVGDLVPRIDDKKASILKKLNLIEAEIRNLQREIKGWSAK